MKTFFKTGFIVGICGIGVVAAAHVVLGKARTHDAVKALRNMAQGEVDELIKKQKDLEEELAKLRSEYPKQIAVIRTHAAEVDRRLDELTLEETRANDIVRLCEQDISYLEDQRDVVGSVYADKRVIEHRGSNYTAIEAQTLIGRIAETRTLYTTRLEDINAERAVVLSEKEGLAVELSELRTEQAEFEAEYTTLLREIERLKRNEELIDLRERKSGCESRHKEAMSTLNDVKSAIERARIEQEERMKAARYTPRSLDYETRAKLLEVQRKRESKRKTQPTAETVVAPDDDKNEVEEEETQLSK
jgi:hypothetical protein